MPEPKRSLKVFLCHASQDKPAVRELYSALKAEGWIDPWLDKAKIFPGQDFRTVIEKAVEESDVVIVCLSTQSVSKEGFVQREIKYAYDIALEKPEETIFLIPLRLDDCVVPRGLRSLHWVNYFDTEKKDAYSDLLGALNLRYEQKLRLEVELARLAKERKESETAEKKKQQEIELKKLESQAIRYELNGDFWNARKAWYEIKRIDPLFPRVEIKISELEQEIAGIAAREKAKRESAGKAIRERQAARKVILTNALNNFFKVLKSTFLQALPFLRRAGFVGIVIALLWGASSAVPKFISLIPTVKATSTQRPIAQKTSTKIPIIPTKTPKPSSTSTPTKTRTPLPTSLPPDQAIILPIIDGTIGDDEWAKSSRVANLPHGVLYFQNDDNYLYMLIDLTGDTVNDNGGDYFDVSFDVNKNGNIDANKDMSYGIGPNNTLVFGYYLLTYAFTTSYPSNSKLGVGFGPSFNSTTPHRIWEMAIALSEISAIPGHNVHFGTTTHSVSPSFTDYYPQTINNDFRKLFQISLEQP